MGHRRRSAPPNRRPQRRTPYGRIPSGRSRPAKGPHGRRLRLDVPQWLLDIFALLDLSLEDQARIVRELRSGSEVSIPRPGPAADRLERAAKMRERTKEPDLGSLLASLGLVSEREVLQAKAQEQGIGFVDLDRFQIAESTLDTLPVRLIKTHGIIPVKREGKTLWIAISDNENRRALDEAKTASGCRVVPVLATPNAIEKAIRHWYRT